MNHETLKECKNTMLGSVKGVGFVLLWLGLVSVLSVVGIVYLCLSDPTFIDAYMEGDVFEQIKLLMPLSVMITVSVDIIMVVVSLFKNRKAPYIKKPNGAHFGGVILLSMLCVMIVNVIEPLLPQSEPYIQAFDSLFTMDFWARIGYVVIIGPILEEVLFRHMVIDSFKTNNKWVPILLSALSFAAIHGNLTQGIPAFFIGLLLGYIYVKTGNLLYTIVFHIVFNSLALITSPVYIVALILIATCCILSSTDFAATLLRKRRLG